MVPVFHVHGIIHRFGGIPEPEDELYLLSFSEISLFIRGGVPQGHGDLYIFGRKG